MPDFENMTVESLRRLARKVLGRGHTRFRTRRDLVKALEAAGASAVKKGPGKAAARSKAATRRGATEAGKGTRRAAGVAGKPSAKRRKVEARPPLEARPWAKKRSAAAAEPFLPEPEEPGLDPDGYFVARVRGEEAAREAPHPMTESAAEEQPQRVLSPGRVAEIAGWKEELGELPWSYEDDVLVALPRDPRTLFLYWDYARATLAQGFAGLEDGRAQLRVFVRMDPQRLEPVRATDVALEARSFYVHDLDPGRLYRAEVHLVDRAGRERMLGRPSNEVWLPSVGPSPILDDRFARLPWDLPLRRWVREGHSGGPFSEEARALLARLSDGSRFPAGVWGGSAGGTGGRPSSPSPYPASSGAGKEGT